jgi:hypothetical protein
MKLEQKTVYFAGSASGDAEPQQVSFGEELVRQVVTRLLNRGARLLVDLGQEHSKPSEKTGRPGLWFAWTALDAAWHALQPRISSIEKGAPPISVIAPAAQWANIPDKRKKLWDDLRKADLIAPIPIPAVSSTRALALEEQVRSGDMALLLSGGAGTEQTAEHYIAEGKPVIPFDLALGAANNDGTGGAARLAKRVGVDTLFRVRGGHGRATSLYEGISTRESKSATQIADATIDLLEALDSPHVFLVRLEDQNEEYKKLFKEVDEFCAEVITPFLTGLDYQVIRIATADSSNFSHIDDIFEAIQNASVVIVDVSAAKPNIYAELGIALGLGKKVVITAQAGTKLPFDIAPVLACFWSRDDPKAALSDFGKHWRQVKARQPAFLRRSLLKSLGMIDETLVLNTIN